MWSVSDSTRLMLALDGVHAAGLAHFPPNSLQDFNIKLAVMEVGVATGQP